jgi:uncharacterized membrane protein
MKEDKGSVMSAAAAAVPSVLLMVDAGNAGCCRPAACKEAAVAALLTLVVVAAVVPAVAATTSARARVNSFCAALEAAIWHRLGGADASSWSHSRSSACRASPAASRRSSNMLQACMGIVQENEGF